MMQISSEKSWQGPAQMGWEGRVEGSQRNLQRKCYSPCYSQMRVQVTVGPPGAHTPGERGLPRFPAGVWAKHSVSRRGLGGPRSQPTMYQARYSHIPKDLGNLDCSGTPGKLGH